MKVRLLILLFTVVSIQSFANKGFSFERIKAIINDQQMEESKKLDSTNRLLRQIPSFSAFKSQLSNSGQTLDSILIKKIELVFLGKEKQFLPLIEKSENILIDEKCSTADSLFTYYTLAIFLRKNGYFNYALDYYLKVLEMYDLNHSFEKRKNLMHAIGLVYYHQNNFENAIKCYNQALQIEVESNDFLLPYQIMNNLGLAFRDNLQYDSALFYFKKIETFLEEELADSLRSERETFFLGLIRGNQGSVYAKLGEYEKAIELLLQDLEISEQSNERLSACNSRISLAEIYLETGTIQLAKKYMDKAFMTANKYNFRSQKRNCLLLYGKYYQQMADYGKSSNYLNQYILLNDSINKELMEQETANFQLELELMDQKNEISLLRMESNKNTVALRSRRQQLYLTLGFSALLMVILAILLINYKNKSKLSQSLLSKNKEVRKRGMQLENALYEKNLMLKEMHHRVKNNLQLVQSLLRLQAAEVNNEKVSQAFEESINRLSSMSLIHQNLYQREKYQNIEFKSYLKSLIQHLESSFQNTNTQVSIELKAEEMDISIDNAIPVGLIINELVSNAFQHAFVDRKSGTIFISLQKEGTEVTLKVSDNGIGLSGDFSLDNHSFGTTLITMLVKQIQGEINFYSDGGAHFSVVFEDRQP